LIVENGQDTQRLHDLSTRMIEVGMVPFAIAMGCLCYLATQPIASPALAVGVGISGTLAAFFFWYALEWIRRQRRTPALLGGEEEDSVPVTDLKAKIEHVLQEARMVLPGAQALLGFQFASILTTSFGRLTPAFQVVHVMALLVIALATILLIAPAAYHRLVEHGEATESFHQVAGRFLLSAIACLGLGMAAEFSVVTWVITHDAFVALVLGTAVLAANYAIWFGYAFYRRRHPLPARIRAS
jgi:hypothetical protein